MPQLIPIIEGWSSAWINPAYITRVEYSKETSHEISIYLVDGWRWHTQDAKFTAAVFAYFGMEVPSDGQGEG